MKRTVIGILAHVDVGKTTLSEAMMYCSGNIRSLGRVDHGSAFLDNFSMERQRGITIFSKQAVLKRNNFQAILLDTPGHIDFSAEMERTLDVLDCAILAISASSGIQSHTFTLWKLLREKNIPTFIFVNKMDQVGADKDFILNSLNQKFGNNFVDFSELDFENIKSFQIQAATKASDRRIGHPRELRELGDRHKLYFFKIAKNIVGYLLFRGTEFVILCADYIQNIMFLHICHLSFLLTSCPPFRAFSADGRDP